MYLTRLKLDETNRETMRALAAPNLLHGTVEQAFPGGRQRRLWRLDRLQGKPCLLLLSEEAPQLAAAAERFCAPGTAAETLPYDPLLQRIAAGSRWHFRLVANPTVCKEGKRLALITAAQQEKWLADRAAEHGFALQPGEFLAVEQKWYRFRKKKGDPHTVSLLGVAFEGELTVLDAERFRKTLCEGIGREKAYGMGLLTVVRVRP